MKIAIIPARAGSKRIPRKNIRDFCGLPIIARTIQEAKFSRLFDQIIVSTDDYQIAEISRNYGAQTPFLRPPHLADDNAETLPVVSHAVQFCLDAGIPVEHACCLYPCNPFLESEDLINAFKYLTENNLNFVYSITEYAHPIQRSMRILPGGKIEFCHKEYELTRTQDLDPRYHDAGQFYWGTVDAWLSKKLLHSSGSGYILPKSRVVDIDDEDDWIMAENLYKILGHKKEEKY